MDKIECIKCKIKTTIKDSKNPIFPCDTCRNYYCGECSELSSSEIKCMPMQKRILKFHCPKCRDNEIIDCLKNSIKDKENIIEDKTTIINMLQDKIAKLEQKQSYADVTSKQEFVLDQQQNINNVPALIIKPLKNQDGQKTKEDVQKTVNPKQMNVSVNMFRTTKNGAVVIKCTTKEGTEKIMNEAKKKLNKQYKVEISKMRKPKIKIIGSSTDMKENEIEDSIREQNPFITSTDYIKVTYIRKEESGKQVIFAECSGQLFKKIMNTKKLFIGWECCIVYEDLTIPRCKKCFGYNHREIDCKNKLACTYCGGEHKFVDCPKEYKKCINCIRSVSTFKLNYEINHEAYNTECPTLKFYIQRHKSNIDYQSK